MSDHDHDAQALAAPISSGAAVRSGYTWNVLNFLFSQGASVAIFLTISHQLSPSVFGVFALAALLVDLFATQGRWAAMDALIQRREFSSRALSTAFWALSALAAVVAALFALGAGGFAGLLSEPEIRRVLPVLGLAALLMPGAAVMDALLMRDLKFRSQVARNVAGTLAGGVCGLAVAFSSEPEWALVVQRLGAGVVTLAALAAITRWRPALKFDPASAAGFLRRAGQLWLSMLLATAHARIVEAGVGIRSGVGALGLLRVAQQFQDTLHGPVTGPIQALWVPLLSRLRDRDAEGWRLYVNLSRLAALLAIPTFVGMGAVSRDLVDLALDDRYAQASHILMVLGLSGFLIPVGYFGNLVFAALDRSDLALKFSLVALALVAPAVWWASGHGVVWTLVASLTIMGAAGLAVTVTQIRMMGGRVATFVAALAPFYLAGALMAAAVIPFGRWLTFDSAAARLACQVALGVAVYVGWLALVHRKAVRAVWSFVSEVRAPEAKPIAPAETLAFEAAAAPRVAT